MTTRHLAILCAVVLGTFSLVFVLPRQLGYQPMGIVMALPEYLGAWWGRNAAVTEKERLTLGPDTEFSRKSYVDAAGDTIYTSIVLAGQDMMTSIHRPERCLQGQGWTTGNASVRVIDAPGLGPFKVTRLQTSKAETRLLPEGQVEQVGTIQSVSYYWFVGATDLAYSHEQRVLMDFKDRIVHGYNQRWAIIMLTSEITAGRQRFGRDEKQTDDLLVDFIKQLAPKILGESVRHQVAAR